MVSLGIVGAGAWGRNHVRVALELRAAGLLDRVLVCDTDAERLKPWKGQAETTTDLRATRSARLDAVTIATPAETHFGLARDLLSAGVHLLVEKPMTTRAVEARELASLAEKEGLVLMPGHIFRYHPGVQELRARLHRREFGDLRYLATVRAAFTPPRKDVGVLFSLGIHEADLYPYLLGLEYPTRARAEVAAFADPRIDEVASLFFTFDGGLVGFAFESWITPGESKERRLLVVGTDRSAELDYVHPEAIAIHESRMIRGPSGWRFEEGEVHSVPVEPREPLREEVEDFVKAVASGGSYRPRADAASGCRAVEIIEALKTSGTFAAPAGR